MTKATERVKEGRRARLREEVYHQNQNLPVNYSCVYKRPDHAAQYLRGWNNVNQVDIDVAVSRVQTNQAKSFTSNFSTTTRPPLKHYSKN